MNRGDLERPAPGRAPHDGSVTRAAAVLDPSARLALIDRARSDRIESGQSKALALIDDVAERSATRKAAIVAETGLDPAKLSLPRGEGGVGGPYISAGGRSKARLHSTRRSCASRATWRPPNVSRRLGMSFVPLRMPLSGDPSLTSGFGYRADPVPRPPRAASGRGSPPRLA